MLVTSVTFVFLDTVLVKAVHMVAIQVYKLAGSSLMASCYLVACHLGQLVLRATG